MSEELKCAKRLISIILSSNPNPASISDLYDIQAGNSITLEKHIKALKNIFEKAYDEIKNSNNDSKSI